ncbi:MAG: heme exporter protein CcmD [Rhizobiales bacterium]|nr:heme exporter protein CcmD [Hyphomicrobiales bacterium]
MSGHWHYVIAAYAVAGAIILAMVAWVVGDYVALGRRMERLGGQSGRRKT